MDQLPHLCFSGAAGRETYDWIWVQTRSHSEEWEVTGQDEVKTAIVGGGKANDGGAGDVQLK